ncbi:MAG: DsbA family protein [Halieaceae bacterium]|nr:DsbA family protein [Halieaceae bacterium]
MSEQFKEQGGAATMDPSRLRRWLTSRFISSLVKPGRAEKIEAREERQRVKSGLPHRLEYFHQVDDAYSHLAAQALRPLLEQYGVELVPHLVSGPSGANLPEPDLLPALGRYDAALIAPHYGLSYPAGADAPRGEHCVQAQGILAAVTAADFPEVAVAVGQALLAGDAAGLAALASQYGSVPEAQARQALASGDARRQELKHYQGGMFFYAGQWYWGVDRLYHLERRWQRLGLGQAAAMLYPRPELEAGSYQANGSLTLEFYASLRSPYTAVIYDKAVALAEQTGVRLALRPVLPMVMRGVPATREKGMYIFADAAREARALGLNFGPVYDPIGEPVRRCYSLYHWAQEQGRGVALLGEFLRAAFFRGVNTSRDQGLRDVVERAGLSWSEALAVIDNRDWEPLLEANRQAMYGFGSWGVPTFRLLDARGNTVVWAWGQDRLWLIARSIQRVLVEA